MAHNGDKFDIRKFNAACIKHGLDSCQERQTIDTLKQARKHFRFDSNRLDYLGRFLEVGEKMETGGYQLWNDIVQAKYPEVGKQPDHKKAEQAVRKMVRYNKQDVKLLINVFEKMKPFIKIPTYTVYSGQVVGCTKCGSQDFTANGWRYLKTQKKRRFRCKTCKSNFDPPAHMIKYYEGALDL